MRNRHFFLYVALTAGSCGGNVVGEAPGAGGTASTGGAAGGSSGSGGRASAPATGGAPATDGPSGMGGAAGGAPGSDGGAASDQTIAPSVPPPPPPPPPPGQIALTALGANGTVGLDWTRDSSAKSYHIYWSNSPGVTPASGQRLESTEPSFVHRGLTNGMTYHYLVAVVTEAGESKLSNPAMATPGGEWALEELGAGDFNDVLTGGRIARLPIEKRIHILLLPEGYLATSLPVFHNHANHNPAQPTNDVDRWVKEIFDLDPYSNFREGFVIWYLPRASSAQIGGGGGTAFGQNSSGAAAPLWAAIDNMGSDVFPYPPTPASRNHVAAFLLFDPARGRAGVSGHASSCPHPTDRSLTIRCNFGIGHAHEFTHSFSDVRDEYMEDSNTRTGISDPWSNVTGTDRCNELPWAHLLFGRGINDKTDQLIGAFGRPQRGYHPEFRCHMNGTHENGTYWCAPGASLTLRPARFCNWCRELTVFRLFFRTGVIPGSVQQAFSAWASMYRRPFFARHPIAVPTPVPQTVACSGQAVRPVYEACAP